MLCRRNPDGSLVYDPSFRDDSAHQPEVLVPESLENPSVDSQASDGFVPGSPPLEDFGESPAPSPPPSPPPAPAKPPPRLRINNDPVNALPPNSPLTPLSYDETSEEEEGEEWESDISDVDGDHYTLTNIFTGEVRRYWHDNNGRRFPYP